MTGKVPLSRPFDIRALRAVHHERIVASAAEREALAEAYGLVSVDALSADLAVNRWRGHGVAVTGRVKAEIVQNCVVTLVPVGQSIDEEISVRFLPDDGKEDPGKEVEVYLDGEDPPETLDGNTIDLGDLAVEHFAVGIDPYPRAPGADLSVVLPSEPADAEPESPFAALAALAGRKSEGE